MKSVTSHHGAGGLPRPVGACSAARRQEASGPSCSPSAGTRFGQAGARGSLPGRNQRRSALRCCQRRPPR